MAKYDAKKQYKWEPDTVFSMSGNEFGLILNTFRSILQKPEAQEILLVNEASKAAEDVLRKSVENGLVEEMSSQRPEVAGKQLAPMSVIEK